MGERTRKENHDEFGRFTDDNLFREYGLFIEDTARFSERRQTFSNVMVAVNALLVAGITILLKDLKPHTYYRFVIALLLLAAGIAACLIWFKLFGEYQEMIRLRIGHLKRIERLAGKKWECKDGMYLMLDIDFYDGKDGKRGFTRLEKLLPLVLIGLYSIFALGMIAVGIGLGMLCHMKLFMTCCQSGCL